MVASKQYRHTRNMPHHNFAALPPFFIIFERGSAEFRAAIRVIFFQMGTTQKFIGWSLFFHFYRCCHFDGMLVNHGLPLLIWDIPDPDPFLITVTSLDWCWKGRTPICNNIYIYIYIICIYIYIHISPSNRHHIRIISPHHVSLDSLKLS